MPAPTIPKPAMKNGNTIWKAMDAKVSLTRGSEWESLWLGPMGTTRSGSEGAKVSPAVPMWPLHHTVMHCYWQTK